MPQNGMSANSNISYSVRRNNYFATLIKKMRSNASILANIHICDLHLAQGALVGLCALLLLLATHGGIHSSPTMPSINLRDGAGCGTWTGCQVAVIFDAISNIIIQIIPWGLLCYAYL